MKLPDPPPKCSLHTLVPKYIKFHVKILVEMRFLGQFHAWKNFLAMSNLPHFGGFSPLKGPPGAPLGGLGGQLRVFWVQGKWEHPAIKKKLGVKIFLRKITLIQPVIVC